MRLIGCGINGALFSSTFAKIGRSLRKLTIVLVPFFSGEREGCGFILMSKLTITIVLPGIDWSQHRKEKDHFRYIPLAALSV